MGLISIVKHVGFHVKVLHLRFKENDQNTFSNTGNTLKGKTEVTFFTSRILNCQAQVYLLTLLIAAFHHSDCCNMGP